MMVAVSQHYLFLKNKENSNISFFCRWWHFPNNTFHKIMGKWTGREKGKCLNAAPLSLPDLLPQTSIITEMGFEEKTARLSLSFIVWLSLKSVNIQNTVLWKCDDRREDEEDGSKHREQTGNRRWQGETERKKTCHTSQFFFSKTWWQISATSLTGVINRGIPGLRVPLLFTHWPAQEKSQSGTWTE